MAGRRASVNPVGIRSQEPGVRNQGTEEKDQSEDGMDDKKVSREPKASVPKPDWGAARRRIILDPTVTMLNTGSFGPLPEPVFDRVTEIRRRLAAGPTDFFVRQAPPLLWEARERTAAFLGTVPHRLIFTTNVSAAIK